MENKFKIGDRVFLRSDSEYWDATNQDKANPQDVEGEIDWIESPSLTVQWDNGTHNSYNIKDLYLVGMEDSSYQIY